MNKKQMNLINVHGRNTFWSSILVLMILPNHMRNLALLDQALDVLGDKIKILLCNSLVNKDSLEISGNMY